MQSYLLQVVEEKIRLIRSIRIIRVLVFIAGGNHHLQYFNIVHTTKTPLSLSSYKQHVMNARQEAKLNMYNALVSYFQNNSAACTALPALTAAIAKLKSNTAAITAMVQQQMKNTTGITWHKKQQSEALITMANRVAGAVHAWAADTGNVALKVEIKTCPSALKALRGEERASVCSNFYQVAVNNKAALINYGVTNEVLASFSNSISNYNNALPAPRNAIAHKTACGSSLQTLIAATDSLLKDNIDKLMLFIDNPILVAEYRSNRSVINNATTVTRLKAKIIAGTTKLPVKNAVLTVQEAGITIHSDAHGQVLLKPAPVGVFTVSITAPGYLPYSIPEYRIIMGHINTINIELKKQPLLELAQSPEFVEG